MAELVYDENGRLLFTKEMKEEYTILFPTMLPVHFGLMARILETEGFHVEMLTTNHRGIVDEGSSTSTTTPVTPPCWSSASSSTR